jgi:hypothetical protein
VPIGPTGTGAAFDRDYGHDGSKLRVGFSCIDDRSRQGTDLADPIRMMTYELETYGRPDPTKAILLLSHGEHSDSADPAVKMRDIHRAEAYAAVRAAKAKGSGV